MGAIACRATGIIYQTDPRPHTVQAGDTLQSIAETAQMSAIELVAFNCGSLRPAIIRRYLRTVFGLTRFRPDSPLDKGVLVVPAPLVCPPGETMELEVSYWRAWYNARFHFVTPGSAEFDDDRFILRSDDGTYECIQTTRDDVDKRNDYLDLDFYGLVPGLTYTLEVDPGEEGEPYPVFTGLPFEELVKDHLPAPAAQQH